jgi:hypothetical protein
MESHFPLKIVNFGDNTKSNCKERKEILLHILNIKKKLNKSKNKKYFNFNNFGEKLEVSIKEKNYIKYQNAINSYDINNKRMRKIQNEKRKRKNKIKIEWTRMDDIKIIELVEIYYFDWQKIAFIMNKPEDLIKQRYEKRLDPKLKFTKLTPDEDKTIINLYKIYGSTWNYISKFFPNRTSIMIKNRFYSCLKKKILLENSVPEKEKITKNDDIEKTNKCIVENNIEINKESYLNSSKNQDSIEIKNQKCAYKWLIRDPKDLIPIYQKYTVEEKNKGKNKTLAQNIVEDVKNNSDKNNSNLIFKSTEQKNRENSKFINNKEISTLNANMYQGSTDIISDEGNGEKNKKNSSNDFRFHELDSLSVKSSFNCFFETIDIKKENSLRESEEMKIFSNLNNLKNTFDFEENDNCVFEKITTNLENDSYNYSTFVNELLENSKMNFDGNEDFSFLNYEFLSEEGKILFLFN